MTESEVTKEIVDFLTKKGWRCLRMQSGLFRSTSGYKGRVRVGEPGMPDWLCLRYPPEECAFTDAHSPPSEFGEREPPTCFWLEVKAPKARTDPKRAAKQEAWADKERERGATVVQFDDPEKFRQWYEETYG